MMYVFSMEVLQQTTVFILISYFRLVLPCGLLKS